MRRPKNINYEKRRARAILSTIQLPTGTDHKLRNIPSRLITELLEGKAVKFGSDNYVLKGLELVKESEITDGNSIQ